MIKLILLSKELQTSLKKPGIMGMIYDKYDRCFLIRECKTHKIWDGLS